MRLPTRPLRLSTALVLLAPLVGCAGGATSAPDAPPSPLMERAERDALSDESVPVELGTDPALVDLLRIALERSPVIAAARERAAAATEGAAIEGWLPNPQVMFGWYETSAQTRVGPQEWSLGVRQAIPFPTKLSTKADIADSEARRMRIVYERAARDVLVEVVQVAHEIVYIDEAVSVTGEIEALLQRYATAAAAGQTSSLVSELFRADTQRAQLENDRVILTELRAVEAQRLRGLLDLPASTRIGTPRTGSPPEVRSSVPELLAIAERHAQELREAGIAVETARLRSSLAEQRRLPDLTLGVTSIRTDRLPSDLGMDPDGNGDDPLILQLGLSVPLWVQRDAAAIRQARSLERAAALDRVDVIQRTRDRVARAWFEVGNASRLDRLYSEVLVPRAALAARTAEDLLASGKGSIAGVLETIAVYHNFRLASARAVADHGRAVAALERAIGRPFDIEDASAITEDVR